MVRFTTKSDSAYVIYINEKKQIKTSPIHVTFVPLGEAGSSYAISHFKIPERHLVCQFVLDRIIMNPTDFRTQYIALTPLEKFLFVSGNINFDIPMNEFQEENLVRAFADQAHIYQLLENNSKPEDAAAQLAELNSKITDYYIYGDPNVIG